jgi:catechol-2,3-dioxygenase
MTPKLDLNHLHLFVRDLKRSRNFYETAFGFKPQAQYGQDLVFLKNRHGFDLALDRVDSVEKLPKGFHFGFSFESREELEEMHGRMKAAFPDSLESGEVRDHESWSNFTCLDPDGNAIELYWDPGLRK